MISEREGKDIKKEKDMSENTVRFPTEGGKTKLKAALCLLGCTGRETPDHSKLDLRNSKQRKTSLCAVYNNPGATPAHSTPKIVSGKEGKEEQKRERRVREGKKMVSVDRETDMVVYINKLSLVAWESNPFDKKNL